MCTDETYDRTDKCLLEVSKLQDQNQSLHLRELYSGENQRFNPHIQRITVIFRDTFLALTDRWNLLSLGIVCGGHLARRPYGDVPSP